MKAYTRSAGILMPVFSLPGGDGIGTLGKAAFRFVDFLKSAGQTYWQVLPVFPTSYGDSPYQGSSVFAGNPYFVDIGTVGAGGGNGSIDYGELYRTKIADLKKLYRQFADLKKLEIFKSQNADWLEDYCLFSVLKAQNPAAVWTDWDEDIKRRNFEKIAQMREQYRDETDFYAFIQYLFFTQWADLKAYANQNGIRIIGDIPIYTNFDSADVWANPDLFELDKNYRPVRVAGCPPDSYAKDGQLWGNPLYDWAKHKSGGYAWWIKRIGHCLKLFDVLRIDHFRGLAGYFAIPAGQKTAKEGVWEKGPGKHFIEVINNWFHSPPIIAEDLGLLTPDVYELLAFSGYPGMRVLQFGFDNGGGKSEHLPHHYSNHTVAYSGTHDNDTSVGFIKNAPPAIRNRAKEYLGIKQIKESGTAFARAVQNSAADLAVVPFADYLNLGTDFRINTPGVLGGNWQIRFQESDFSSALAKKIRTMTENAGRLP